MARRSDKRERLLDAAAEAFWVDGFAATSLADIAERSGVPVGNIYYYFKTKAAIAEGVADIFIESSLQSLNDIDRTNHTPTEKLRAFISLLKESAEPRAKRGCPLANAIRDFSPSVPVAAETTNSVFTTLIGWISQTLNKSGDRNAVRHARIAIARWQGAIVLAQGTGEAKILIEALNELEADLLLWAKASK